MRKLNLLLCSSLFLIPLNPRQGAGLSQSQQRSNAYRTYANARFDYSISYPASLLIPQGESANGDGQVFRARDGSAEMRVYGRNNVNNETLRGLFSELSREWGTGV